MTRAKAAGSRNQLDAALSRRAEAAMAIWPAWGMPAYGFVSMSLQFWSGEKKPDK